MGCLAQDIPLIFSTAGNVVPAPIVSSTPHTITPNQYKAKNLSSKFRRMMIFKLKNRRIDKVYRIK